MRHKPLMVSSFAIFACVTLPATFAQHASGDVIHIGPGVTSPRVLHKVEPEYSPLARADHVQGTVVLEIVVSDKWSHQDNQPTRFRTR
jgi:hypothetical protein